MTEPSDYATQRALERQAERNPEQVLVNVADLRRCVRILGRASPDTAKDVAAWERLRDAVGGVPDWEPTDDVAGQVERAYDKASASCTLRPSDFAVALAQALHREGLL